MKITDIYSKYKIMPSLGLHQLRVASVAKMICDAIPNFSETNTVIETCLLHDMGNIIKSDLNYYPDFTKPEGLQYWQGIKNEFIAKYGNSEHDATDTIMKETGVPKKSLDFFHCMGFSKLKETLENNSIPEKICAYADMRVGPYGILSIEERLSDGKKRYEGRIDHAIGEERRLMLAGSLHKIESQLSSIMKIKPEDITDTSIAGIIEELKNFEI